MIFLDTFKHLLPKARAWSLTINKQLRQFFDGLSLELGDSTKLFFDEIYQDIDPQLTRELESWEKQFNLPDSPITEQERRDRLDATWKARGGQSPRYLQDTLQAAGFNVFIHEWWVPGTEPPLDTIAAATARDPNAVLAGTGYTLVNKILVLGPPYYGDGSIEMNDGGDLAQDGGVDGANNFYQLKIYPIPTDPLLYPYFLYIGDAVFPNHATVPLTRKNEFETLCLKICPTHLWLGMLVDYT